MMLETNDLERVGYWRERIAQLVRQHGQELIFLAICLFEGCHRIAEVGDILDHEEDVAVPGQPAGIEAHGPGANCGKRVFSTLC